MKQPRTYLDWNATTPLRPQARDAMIAALDVTGNPSSVHAEGREARRLVTEARAALAAALGAEPRNVIFTSGGTEANVTSLAPGLRRGGGPAVARLLVSAIEHPSVLAGGRFPADRMARIRANRDGVVDLADLAARLADGPPALVSLMLANNETGAIQPVAAAADLVHGAGGLLHVDAVQAFGRMPILISELKADLVTVSGHKIGGPKGVGAVILAGDVNGPDPLIAGGGQEQGRRAGTENVAGIAGFGAAATAAMAALAAETGRMATLRERLERGLRQYPALEVFSQRTERLPNTSLVAMPGLRAETTVIALDLAGVAVSSGSACSSGKVTSSHVLAAMGVGHDLAAGAIRFSLGWDTTEADVDRALEAWRTVSGSLAKR